MWLEIGEYEIPEDCTAKVYKGIVYVAPKLPKGRLIGRTNAVKYCRDCKHRIIGYINRSQKSKVCELQPKFIMNRRIYGERAKYSWEFRQLKTYYAAKEYGTICKHFKDKKETL